MKTTEPEVFIIESLKLKDEEQNHPEGRRIADMISLSGDEGKQCKYFYIRTKTELVKILKVFKKSNYRYLHLSCHGTADEMGRAVGLAMTFDSLSFEQIAKLLKPYISNRRVFLSACSAAKSRFAELLMNDSGCFSVMGPSSSIRFPDAALFWASFYHLMFKEDALRMTTTRIKANGIAVAKLFGVRMRLFSKKHGELIVDSLK